MNVTGDPIGRVSQNMEGGMATITIVSRDLNAIELRDRSGVRHILRGIGSTLTLDPDMDSQALIDILVAIGSVDTGSGSNPTAPAQITSWTWTTGLAASQIVASITAPSNGGSAITGYEYSLDGGTTAVPLSGASPWTLTMAAAGTSYTAMVRARNAIGAGAWSTSKTATSGTAVATAPSQFGTSDWSVATGAAASQITLTVSALPSDGGSAITALQYTINGGTTWTALSGAGSGSRILTMPAEGVSYTFALRAVNSVGSGAASATKTATSGSDSATVPAAFAAGDWTFATAAATGQAVLTLSNVPARATAVDYTFDDGTTVHTLWSAAPGARNIPNLLPGASQSCRIRARNDAGASAWATAKSANAGAVKGLTAATVSISPSSRYWAGDAANTVETDSAGGSRVTTLADSVGGFPLSAAVELCPTLRTDPFGRKFLHMSNVAQVTSIGLRNDTIAIDPTNITVIAALRYCAASSNTLVASNTAGTTYSLLAGSTNGTALVVNNSSSGTASPARHMSQTLCIVSARASKTGSTYNNTGGVNGLYDNFGASVSNQSGAGIGLICAGSGVFQVYELLVYNRAMTQAEVDTVTAELCAHYGISALNSIVVFEGDSITYGAGGGVSYSPSAQVASNLLVPDGFRIVNAGLSGHTIENITGELSSAGNWSQYWTAARVPNGRRVLVLQIGRNNASNADLAAVRTAYANYLTAANGPLALGWEVIVLGNIGTSASIANNNLNALRTWLGSEEFLSAVQAGPGQTYEGKVKFRPVYLATAPDGSQPFAEMPTGSNNGWYYDGTHITETGSGLMVTGGLTPHNGAVYDIA